MSTRFEFYDRLHPGEGRSFDVVSDVDVSGWSVSADLTTMAAPNTLIARPNVTSFDQFTWRVHVTDSMTQGQGGTKLVLTVTLAPPDAPNEPDKVTALLTIDPL